MTSSRWADGAGRGPGGRWTVAVGALLAWTLLWRLPWQAWLVDWPWVAVAASLVMLIVPGACALRWLRRSAGGPALDTTAGLAISTGLVGLLGLAARLLHLSFPWIRETFFVVGGLLLLLACLVDTSREPAPGGRRGGLAVLALVLVALALAARVGLTPSLHGGDQFSYLALITRFQESDALGFGDTVFGGDGLAAPRLWLAFWPLAEAVLADTSGLHALEIVGVHLDPLLVVLALLAAFALARGLGLSPSLAALALVAQLASLIALSGADQVGAVVFDRIQEDKVVAAAVLAPAVLRLAVDYLWRGTGRDLVLLVGGGLGLAFTHPTILGITAVIAAAYALLDALATGRWRYAALVMAALALLCLPSFGLRFVERPQPDYVHFSVVEAQGDEPLEDYRARRLAIRGDPRFYGLHPDLLAGWPFVVLAAAAVGALVRWRRSRTARLILASVLVLLAAVVPYTGWILGRAITPFHLWRVPWLMPLGIAMAFCARGLLALLARRREGLFEDRLPGRAAASVLAVALLGVAVGGLTTDPDATSARSVALPAEWRTTVFGPRPGKTCAHTYDELRAVARLLDEQIDTQAVVVGDTRINNVIPGLTPKARLVQFRQFPVQGAYSPEETAIRIREWRRMVAEGTTPIARARLLRKYGVQLLLLCDEPDWVPALQERHPGLIHLVGQVGDLWLYSVRS